LSLIAEAIIGGIDGNPRRGERHIAKGWQEGFDHNYLLSTSNL